MVLDHLAALRKLPVDLLPGLLCNEGYTTFRGPCRRPSRVLRPLLVRYADHATPSVTGSQVAHAIRTRKFSVDILPFGPLQRGKNPDTFDTEKIGKSSLHRVGEKGSWFPRSAGPAHRHNSLIDARRGLCTLHQRDALSPRRVRGVGRSLANRSRFMLRGDMAFWHIPA